MSDPEIHIAAWESAGLIDAPTAARLRSAALAAGPAGAPDLGAEARERRPGRVSSVFGPTVTVGEVFAYVGAAFVLAAWTAWIARVSEGRTGEFGLGALIAAVALAGIGIALRGGSERRRRGAGVAFVHASAMVGIAGISFGDQAGLGSTAAAIVGASSALVVATALRWLLPAVLTQLGVLGAGTTLAAAVLSWLRETVAGPLYDPYAIGGPAPAATIDPVVLAVVEALVWIGVAVAFGLLGLYEARSSEGTAARRAAVTRVWAGLTAVAGVATSVSRSTLVWNGQYYDSHRVLEPWVADLAILLVSAVLVERAFRREASAYVFAAALGIVIAATDLNFTYLTNTRELGLLIEGAILLSGGYAAERLRRRIDRLVTPSLTAPPGTPAA